MLHINLVPFATAGGVGGIVLGFASQSVLANIVAGCNLLITRPLVVGDRVTLAGAAIPAAIPAAMLNPGLHACCQEQHNLSAAGCYALLAVLYTAAWCCRLPLPSS